MGYESHFEVPDIDDSLLRGVDDLTDLLCPDSHPEDYTNRVRFAHHHQGKILLFARLCLDFFSFPQREVFSRCDLAEEIFSIVFSRRAERASLSSFPRVGRSVGRRVHSFALVRRGRKRPAHFRSFERERDKGKERDFLSEGVQNPTPIRIRKNQEKEKDGH